MPVILQKWGNSAGIRLLAATPKRNNRAPGWDKMPSVRPEG